MHLDVDEDDSPNFKSVQDQYDKNRELDAKNFEARLGYALYDFLKFPAPIFGTWNGRILDHSHVSNIRCSIYNEGCDNRNVKTAFTFVVDPKLIDPESLSSED